MKAFFYKLDDILEYIRLQFDDVLDYIRLKLDRTLSKNNCLSVSKNVGL